MPKYHINKKGKVKPCNATTRACPFGEENHIEANSPEEALEKFDEIYDMEDTVLAKIKKDTFDFTKLSKDPKERIKEITENMQEEITNLFESEKYQKYLDAMSKFHKYSFGNTLLIILQKPEASLVGGYNFWKDKMKRQVRKGEKAITILAPNPVKTKTLVDKIDEKGKRIIDKEGNPEKEEKEIVLQRYKVVPVFDVSQTEGEDIPSLGVDQLTGDVENFEAYEKSLKDVSPVPIEFEDITNGAKGYFSSSEKKIGVKKDMSQAQTLKTMIHEIAHARLHDTSNPDNTETFDKRTKEVQAESIAYTVCKHYGLDTSDYSFGYIASWSGNKELKSLKLSLNIIQKETNNIIDEIDKQMAA